jgi:hypothetical protein
MDDSGGKLAKNVDDLIETSDSLSVNVLAKRSGS